MAARRDEASPFLRWLAGTIIALILALSGFFVAWQRWQDEAIAGCMGGIERQTIQSQIRRLQDTMDRNQIENQKVFMQILRQQANVK
jgi:hypothetical protein